MIDQNNHHDIDRLVDGELSPERRRDLLMSCERNDAWRDVALAFVEAQTLRTELKLFAGASEAGPSLNLDTRANASAESTRPGLSFWNPLSLAAAVLVALGIGYGAGTIWQGIPAATGIVQVPQDVDQDRSESPSPYSSLNLTVSDDRQGGLQQIQLPVVAASSLGPDWPDKIATELPDELMSEMHRQGFGVSRNRQLIPVRLHDGRTVIVPIEYYHERSLQ